MTMGKNRQGEFLDGELCTNLWLELGSLDKVSKRLEKMGIINKTTQKRVTPMGVRIASGKWMCMHPIEARNLLLKIPGNEKFLDDDEFSKYLVRLAINSLGKKQFRLFLQKYDLYQIYEEVRIDKNRVSDLEKVE